MEVSFGVNVLIKLRLFWLACDPQLAFPPETPRSLIEEIFHYYSTEKSCGKWTCWFLNHGMFGGSKSNLIQKDSEV